MTLEAVARNAASSSASGVVIDDELASALESLNQYKGGRGSDRSRMLKLWTGEPLHSSGWGVARSMRSTCIWPSLC